METDAGLVCQVRRRLRSDTRTLLALADRKRFQFVGLFIHQDYDRLADTIQAPAPEFVHGLA